MIAALPKWKMYRGHFRRNEAAYRDKLWLVPSAEVFPNTSRISTGVRCGHCQVSYVFGPDYVRITRLRQYLSVSHNMVNTGTDRLRNCLWGNPFRSTFLSNLEKFKYVKPVVPTLVLKNIPAQRLNRRRKIAWPDVEHPDFSVYARCFGSIICRNVDFQIALVRTVDLRRVFGLKLRSILIFFGFVISQLLRAWPRHINVSMTG